MMRTPDVAAVDRLVRSPRRVVSGVHRLCRGALDNALRSLEEIARSVDDRHRLQDHLEAADAPGDLAALGVDECYALLGSTAFGRLAYVARAGVPDVVPVNYCLSGDGVLIRTGSGPKLQAAQRGDTVAFEVDHVDEADRSGWSVVVVGRLSVVEPDEPVTGPAPQPWATGPRRHQQRLEPRRVTARPLLGEVE
jgi:hypothetical protein